MGRKHPWLRLAVRCLVFSVVYTLLLLASVAVLPDLGSSLVVSVAALAVVVTAGELLFPSAGRKLPPTSTSASRPYGVVRVVAITCTAAVFLSALAAFAPRPSEPAPAGPDRDISVPLPGGGDLAARSYGTPSDRPPLVVVHGGPGVPFSSEEEQRLSGLAGDRQVFVYDQVGVGRSSSLGGPEEYTFTRAVSDLRSFVDYVRAPRVSLLGYSWGAEVATAYAARFPERLDRLILLSPGPFPWADEKWPPAGPQSRLSTSKRLRFYAEAVEPRNLFLYGVTAVRPEATLWFASEQELDSRFHNLYQLGVAGLSCRPLPHFEMHGLGFFASQVPQLHPDLSGVRRSDLRRLQQIPTLIVRGECDYIDATAAREYAEELPQSKLVHLADAGHALLVERPAAARQLLLGFLEPEGPS